jgi:hypothetical protein
LRSGKVDVSEVLVLSAALSIPPILLLFPQFSTDSCVEVLPGVITPGDEAVRWFTGRISLPEKVLLTDKHVVSVLSPLPEKAVNTREDDESGLQARVPVDPASVRAGDAGFEDRRWLPNEGVKLVGAAADLEEALKTRMALIRHLDNRDPHLGEDAETAERMLELNAKQVERIREDIREADIALWQAPDSGAQEGESDD